MSIALEMNFFIEKNINKVLIIDLNDLLYHTLMINHFTALSNNNYQKGVDMFLKEKRLQIKLKKCHTQI
jgi:hypothetical protein